MLRYLHLIINQCFGFKCLCMSIFNIHFKKTLLKQKYCDNANRYRSVSQVEDWPEKFKVFSSPNWDPQREMCITDDREVKHINNFSM